MLLDLVSKLAGARLVLASASPRRIEILSSVGLKVEVEPSKFEETLDKSTFSTPEEYCLATARGKALEVWQRIAVQAATTSRPVDMVIAGDTIVILGDRILEKPADRNDAVKMLKSLSGQAHRVCTGVVLVTPSSDVSAPVVTSFHELTHVEFDELPDELIDAYVATGEPMDKAGGYGIQGPAGSFVTGIRGCYYNVMGFPLHSFCKQLRTHVQTLDKK